MQIITQNPAERLVDMVRNLRGSTQQAYAIFFHLSGLQEHYRSDFQLKVALNILNDIFRTSPGGIISFPNGDIVLIYQGPEKKLLEKAAFQLRYLFVDDPLATHEDGSENDRFCDTYDLAFQWRPFYRICVELVESAGGVVEGESTTPAQSPERELQPGELRKLEPSHLVRIERDLGTVDLGMALRTQPICIQSDVKSLKPVMQELYVNISHMRRLINTDCDLRSDRWLFKHLTAILDGYILRLLAQRTKLYLSRPLSLNMNVDTLLSSAFIDFHEKIIQHVTPSLVFEIDIADVFCDMRAFVAARDLLHELGYRVCLDGVSKRSFIQVERDSLGVDMVKLQWNMDMARDLSRDENRRLVESVRQCGANRIILCRCDSKGAIEYGTTLGISMFQGRHIDRMLNPDAKVIN